MEGVGRRPAALTWRAWGGMDLRVPCNNTQGLGRASTTGVGVEVGGRGWTDQRGKSPGLENRPVFLFYANTVELTTFFIQRLNGTGRNCLVSNGRHGSEVHSAMG